MPEISIKNSRELLKNSGRSAMLKIVEAGLNAIETENIIKKSVSLLENKKILKIKDFEISLSRFRRIKIIGFGKASCEAALTLEKIFGNKIKGGVVIDVKAAKCEYITSLVGTHPRPSKQNILATRHILELAKETNKDDLILAVVSGGGSALLCWPEEECEQGKRLFSDFLKVGGDVRELNIVRKHLSFLKGGGLAKLFYPAAVVGLIFCDVPGGSAEEVASGPTFKDSTTMKDAEAILDKYGLSGYTLTETPKEDIYFEKVVNIPLVTNVRALSAMARAAKRLGFQPKIFSAEIGDGASAVLKKMKRLASKKTVILGGGEIKLAVKKGGGSGGRNTHLALAAAKCIGRTDIFVSVASDGIDNSDAAGAIVDLETIKKAKKFKLRAEDYLQDYDSYDFFKKTKDLIFTGPTGANVSDLMIWMRK